MTLCPHGHGELDASGNCPKQNLHVKARVGIACPLCGGPAHKRETDATTQQLQCAWRQYTRAQGHTGMLPLEPASAANFASWLAGGSKSYGREAQYQALAASGTPLSPAMAKDAARYIPGATPTVVAPPTVEAQHTPAQKQLGPIDVSDGLVLPNDLLAEAAANGEMLVPERPPTMAGAPAGETPDERRARLRQALAS